MPCTTSAGTRSPFPISRGPSRSIPSTRLHGTILAMHWTRWEGTRRASSIMTSLWSLYLISTMLSTQKGTRCTNWATSRRGWSSLTCPWTSIPITTMPGMPRRTCSTNSIGRRRPCHPLPMLSFSIRITRRPGYSGAISSMTWVGTRMQRPAMKRP